MRNEEVILETVEWVERHIKDPLPVSVIATKAGYSLHHFNRLFTGVVGIGPKEYVLRRKLSEAAQELARGRRGVTDTALDYGFSDPDGFSRAFRREFGVSPSAIRKGMPFRYFPMPDTLASGKKRQSDISERLRKSARILRAEETLLAGWIADIGQPDGIANAWELFGARAESIAARKKPTRFRQFAWWNDWDEESLGILVAVEMQDLVGLPLDLVVKVSPAADCLVFEHEGPMSSIQECYARIYSDILPDMDRKPVFPCNFETYPEAQETKPGIIRFMIWIPIA